MIPQEGQQIIVIFRNGLQISGEVLNWSDGKSTLKTMSGSSVMVINDTKSDVMVYKIFNNTKETFEEIKEKVPKQQEDIKQLAELRKELNELEKEEIREKLNTHQPTLTRQNYYGLPHSNIKIEGNQKHPGKKIESKNNRIHRELQNLFNKKH